MDRSLETGKLVLEGPAKDVAADERVKKAYLGDYVSFGRGFVGICLALTTGCASFHHQDLAPAPPKVGVHGNATVVHDRFMGLQAARAFYAAMEAPGSADSVAQAEAAYSAGRSRFRRTLVIGTMIVMVAGGILGARSAPYFDAKTEFAYAGTTIGLLAGPVISLPFASWGSKSKRRETHEAVRTAADAYNAGVPSVPENPDDILGLEENYDLPAMTGDTQWTQPLELLESFYRGQGAHAAAQEIWLARATVRRERLAKRIGLGLGLTGAVVAAAVDGGRTPEEKTESAYLMSVATTSILSALVAQWVGGQLVMRFSDGLEEHVSRAALHYRRHLIDNSPKMAPKRRNVKFK